MSTSPLSPEAPEAAQDPASDADVEAAWNDAGSWLWQGIPRAIIDRIGACDTDTAGGCG